MRKFVVIALVLLVGSVLLFGAFGPALAGQPNQSCQAQPNTPGNSSTAPGSAFNTSGVSGGVYAGTQLQNSNNPKSVSQYDVACANVSSH